jgi:lipopolysaccharide transport system ATP-binding protein
VQLGAALDNDLAQRLHLLTSKGYVDWSPPEIDTQGRSFRQFQDCRGQYRHAPFSVRVPLGLGNLESFSLQILHAGSIADDGVVCQMFNGNEYVTIGSLDFADRSVGHIFTQYFPMGKEKEVVVEAEPKVQPIRSVHDYGTGTVKIKAVDFLTGDYESRRLFVYGESLIVFIDWVSSKNIIEMTFIVCFYGMDGSCVSQVVSPFVAATDVYRSGRVQVHFDPLMIGCGDYAVTIGIFEGFTVQQSVGQYPLDVQHRSHRIKVVAPDHIKMNCGTVVHPVTWTVK